MQVQNAIRLNDSFHAVGGVNLFGAKIGSTLDCEGGSFNNGNGLALDAEQAKIGAAVLLRNGFNAEGEVRLRGAEIGGVLECSGGSSFKNGNGIALNAQRAKVGGDVLLRNDFKAEGQVRLFQAEIGGGLWNVQGAETGAATSRTKAALHWMQSEQRSRVPFICATTSVLKARFICFTLRSAAAWSAFEAAASRTKPASH